MSQSPPAPPLPCNVALLNLALKGRDPCASEYFRGRTPFILPIDSHERLVPELSMSISDIRKVIPGLLAHTVKCGSITVREAAKHVLMLG